MVVSYNSTKYKKFYTHKLKYLQYVIIIEDIFWFTLYEECWINDIILLLGEDD